MEELRTELHALKILLADKTERADMLAKQLAELRTRLQDPNTCPCPACRDAFRYVIGVVRDGAFNAHTQEAEFRAIGYARSLEEARSKRVINCDLVFDRLGEIVQDRGWLFVWEQEQPSCYARTKMAEKTKIATRDLFGGGK